MKLHEVANQERSILTVMGEQEDPFNGDFKCQNKMLASLEGAPRHISGNFWCSFNQLTSLEGAPSHVGGDFKCSSNQLTSLEGAPSHIGGDFWCNQNQLTSLEGAPSHVDGDFWCQNNKLTSLEGAPSYVNQNFVCRANQLTSIKGIHKYIRHIGGMFDATGNPITSNILGLLLIDGVNQVVLDNGICQNIINKYLGKGKRGMFDAQQELIEAGFQEMAKL